MTQHYHIMTFGCQMNERDSEILAGMLHEIVMNPQKICMHQTLFS